MPMCPSLFDNPGRRDIQPGSLEKYTTCYQIWWLTWLEHGKCNWRKMSLYDNDNLSLRQGLDSIPFSWLFGLYRVYIPSYTSVPSPFPSLSSWFGDQERGMGCSLWFIWFRRFDFLLFFPCHSSIYYAPVLYHVHLNHALFAFVPGIHTHAVGLHCASPARAVPCPFAAFLTSHCTHLRSALHLLCRYLRIVWHACSSLPPPHAYTVYISPLPPVTLRTTHLLPSLLPQDRTGWDCLTDPAHGSFCIICLLPYAAISLFSTYSSTFLRWIIYFYTTRSHSACLLPLPIYLPSLHSHLSLSQHTLYHVLFFVLYTTYLTTFYLLLLLHSLIFILVPILIPYHVCIYHYYIQHVCLCMRLRSSYFVLHTYVSFSPCLPPLPCLAFACLPVLACLDRPFGRKDWTFAPTCL